MKILLIMLIALGIMTVLILWSAMTVPLSEYERMLDDEAQEEFLRKWKEKKKNK